MIEQDRVLWAKREKGPAYKQAVAAGKGCVEKMYYVLVATHKTFVGRKIQIFAFEDRAREQIAGDKFWQRKTMSAMHKQDMMQIICLLGLRNGSPKTRNDLLLNLSKLVCKNAFCGTKLRTLG